jgi:hypothetical protein
MVTEDDVRRVALSLPETAEKPYNRLPSFRVRSSLFIRVHELPGTLFVRCADLDERNELLKAEPGKFFITPHYDGYPGILVRLSQVDPGEVTELITESWRICAPKRLLAAYERAPTRTLTGRPGGGPTLTSESRHERTPAPGAAVHKRAGLSDRLAASLCRPQSGG